MHLDTFSGIAGNMFLGALLDAGLPRRKLTEGLAGLGVPHRLRVRRVQRGALAARYVEVLTPRPRGGLKARHGRRYQDIRRLLERAKLPAPVRARAQAIFLELARAEARVHGVALDAVHFHEVGAVDAIVDITGAALALDALGISKLTATPPALGHGVVDTAHGRLPLPAPATLELLRGLPTVPAEVEWETVTPTGAAILRSCVDAFQPLPAMTIDAIGHGAGDDRGASRPITPFDRPERLPETPLPEPMPNVLRAVLGRSALLRADRVVCLEANLDDFVPEHFDHVRAELERAGALDVSLQHLQMKKSRPGFLLRVIAKPDRRAVLASRILAETTSLGVRIHEFERLLLPREVRKVTTSFGRIAVKVSLREDGRRDYSAEYEDCRRAATRAGVPLRDVIRSAESKARSSDE